MMDSGKRTARDRLMGLVMDILGPARTPQPIPVNERLADIGMSSINMVNLMLAVEAEFDITIPQTQITPENFRSIASIEVLVGRLTAPSIPASDAA
ncbi:MAG TPA: phosphopantetheine-binding protein [Burkholderiaceae bacterium]|nr:phosphopantetheine-binding protein [Burkholderiaceae bacterium]HYB50630.1 phosphopantetheine-binding protein [Burkholderiaceae bacterium]